MSAPDESGPVLRIGGREVYVDGRDEWLRIVEDPLSRVLVDFNLAALDLEHVPEPTETVEVEVSDKETIQGVVTVVEPRSESQATHVQVHLGTKLEEALSPLSVSIRDQPRSALLRRGMQGLQLASAQSPKSDEPHPYFVSLGESRWIVAGRLALLGGQTLLATTQGYVLAVPADPPARGTVVPDEHSCARSRAVPELRLTAMDGTLKGDVVTHRRAGASALGSRGVFMPHTASAGELAAAANAIAAIMGRGEFSIRGGPELLGISPGKWVQLQEGGVRLVTRRERMWTEEGGWHVSLQGGYPWETILAHSSRLQAEPVEVLGLDQRSGFLRVRLLRHDMEVIAGQRENRAGRESFVATMPNPGDRGTVIFTGAFEQALYVGGAIPSQVLGADDFSSVQILRAKGASSRLTGDGRLEEWFQGVIRKCNGLVKSCAKKFEFTRQS